MDTVQEFFGLGSSYLNYQNILQWVFNYAGYVAIHALGLFSNIVLLLLRIIYSGIIILYLLTFDIHFSVIMFYNIFSIFQLQSCSTTNALRNTSTDYSPDIRKFSNSGC